MEKMFRLLGVCLLAAAVFAGSYAAWLYGKANGAIAEIGASRPVAASQDAAKPEPDPKPARLTEPVTFLLLGVDTRKQSDTLNTDVVMAVSLNPADKSATVVSLPRDLQLKPKGLPSRKANAYYAIFANQNKAAALDKTKALFADFLGTPIDYAVTLDFNGFVEVVDALGGLTIDVDMDMRYEDHWDGTNINLTKGTQKLDGRQTLDFVRYRKSNEGTEMSDDHERNMRQHQVLEKLVSKLNSAGGLIKLGQMMEIAGRNVKTDMPASQIKSFLFTYMGIKKENIRFIPINGEWVSPYVVVKNRDLDEARQALKQELEPNPAASAAEAAGARAAGGGAGLYKTFMRD